MKKPTFTCEMQDDAEEVLKRNLPHGSGINCDWTFEWMTTAVICRNSYHCMNDNGFYEGYADFSITLHYAEDVSDFRLKFHGYQAQRLNRKHMLREYLTETFFYALTDEGVHNPVGSLGCFSNRMKVEIIN